MNSTPKDRMMKFPYTLTSKLYFFPYRYYYKHAWLCKYWLIGVAITAPVMMMITKMVNSPENVEKWREIRKKQLEMHH